MTKVIFTANGQDRLGRNRKNGWLLLGASVLAFAAQPAAAETIDNGAVETVNGSGDGTSGTINSPWSPSIIFIGSAGSGSLTVEAGAAVSTSDSWLSIGNGSTSTLVVTGSGSSLANTGYLSVGQLGTSSLTVADGGSVSAQYLWLGEGGSAVGTATITGAGSELTSTSLLYVGWFGKGHLVVENGGSVSSSQTSIAISASAANSDVLVTGAGSNWHNSGSLSVGTGAAATLTITDGGAVTTGSGGIGYLPGSNGTIAVAGAGSSMDVADIFSVGVSGNGRLNITNGAQVSSVTSYIAGSPGAVGAVTIDGVGSNLNTTALLIAGYEGAASITVSGGGVLNTARTYLGLDVLGTGDATVTGAGARWNSTDTLTVGMRGSGELTVADGGLVSAGTVILGEDVGGVGTLSIGGASGQAAAAPGQLDVQDLQFGIGTGTLAFNHTGTNYTFDTTLSGDGTITQVAGVTKLTGDASTFSGTTNVIGGGLYVNGTLGGTISVTGGRLGGSGLTHDISIGSGGTVAPGNSIGTLHVDGSLAFASGSIYQVEVNDAGNQPGVNNDYIVATGAITLGGGTVQVLGGGANGQTYLPYTTYTILRSGQSVTGAFSAVTDDFAFLDAMLSYSADSVFLTLVRNDIDFAGMAATDNQRAVGAAVQGLGFGNGLYDTVLFLDESGARRGFDALSGEIHASAQTALIEDSRYARDAVYSRLSDPGEGGGVWGQAFGTWDHQNGNGNAARMGHDVSGFFSGLDAPLGDDVRLGTMIGYSHSSIDAAARGSNGQADSWTWGAYAASWFGNMSFNLGGALTWHDIKTDRSIAFADISENAHATYSARTGQMFAEAAWKLGTGSKVTAVPFVQLAYVDLSTSGYRETVGMAALNGAKASQNVTFTTLGIRGKASLGDKVVFAGAAGWRHAFGGLASRTPSALQAFSGGDSFAVSGLPIAGETMFADLGVTLQMSKKARFSTGYQGEFGSSLSSHGVKAALSVDF